MNLSDKIAAPLAAALAARGYETLTPVQAAMLADDALGSDLLVSAQTGSGKTVAFGIALAPVLLDGADRFGRADRPLALAIAPTRELAMQVRRELEWLYRETGARFASCIGGMPMRGEVRALDEGAHIVVGTPGRLRDHITRGSLDMTALRAVVLDEADEMLDLGFREDLEFILDAAPQERRTLLFSATVAPAIAKLAKRYQRDARRIELKGESDQHGDITYHLMPVSAAERDHAVINTLLYFDSANTIIFCQTRDAVRHLAARLHNRGFSVVALSGELTQGERTNALQAMRDGRARVCVATDVAARGIDLPNLDLVIHADMPTNPETLLHRSGRTGRAGRKGTAVVIAPQHRRRTAERVLNTAKVNALFMAPPSADAILERDRERMLADPVFLEPVEADDNEMIAALLERHSPEQIAAAWLKRERAARPVPEEVMGVREPAPRAALGERPDTRFTNGVWFALSLGRRNRAEPRWILPIICKAGGVTKKAVGSIRILEHETRFEIDADKAEAYAAALERGETLEKGATIHRFEGDPAAGGEDRPDRGKPKPHRKGKAPGAEKPAGKKWAGKPGGFAKGKKFKPGGKRKP